MNWFYGFGSNQPRCKCVDIGSSKLEVECSTFISTSPQSGIPLRVLAVFLRFSCREAALGQILLAHNDAGVSVGISHDTAEFAVAAIQRWWTRMGKTRYSSANRLLITADSGGSNSPRTRLWRWELQRLANSTGLIIEVCHYPPGTSKWNKIEHRLFCHITRNWRGIPLENLTVVINLIGSTKTEEGLEVHAWLDRRQYEKARKVSDTQLSEVRMRRNRFYGDWNYEILPNHK